MVDYNSLKNELQNIICGENKNGKSELIKTTQTYLKKRFETSSGTEKKEYSREQEEESLRNYISGSGLWVSSGIFGTYITEGAEQKVYFTEGSTDVIKISDAIFYVVWLDYFNNLLIHNHLFPDTAYTLIGFYNSVTNCLLF